jgi:hypothetical protein
MTTLEQSLAVLRTSIHSKMMQQEDRIRQLDEMGASSNRASPKRSAAPAGQGLSIAGLEFLLAHAHLPAPGGRILDSAGILDHGGLDLASLGYEVHRGRFTSSEENSWNAILCRLENETSEVCAGLVADALHGLRPGGRLILSLPMAADAEAPAWLTGLPACEIIRAHRDESMWRFNSVGANQSGQGESLIVGVMEKP